MSRERAPWEQEPPAPPSPPAPTAAEKAEAAKIRRRWINLGELLAVIAVCISALTLWNSWSERNHSETERAAAERKAARASSTLVLKAVLNEDADTLTLAPADSRQTIQSQRLLFPARLGIDPIDTTGDARMEAGWIDKAAKDKPHDRELRVPVAIVTRFVGEAGDPVESAALYQLGYRVEGRLLGSATKLTGLALTGRVPVKDAQKRVDAAR